MNDRDLNDLLKSASVPDRPAEYWGQFPARVTKEMMSRERQGAHLQARKSFAATELLRSWSSALRLKPVVAFTLVPFICLGLVLLWVNVRKIGAEAASDAQIVEAQKYYHEIESLFPNQVQAIVLDQSGPRLVLAKNADVPQSTPLYLKICQPAGCQRFITFSGQQIQINGETCDVLLDREGRVLIVGRETVWSGSAPVGKAGGYRIEAKPLGGTT